MANIQANPYINSENIHRLFGHLWQDASRAEFKIWCQGYADGPGKMSIAVLCEQFKDGVALIPSFYSYVWTGSGTNHKADLLAVLHALDLVKNKNLSDVCIYSSSDFVAKIITGNASASLEKYPIFNSIFLKMYDGLRPFIYPSQLQCGIFEGHNKKCYDLAKEAYLKIYDNDLIGSPKQKISAEGIREEFRQEIEKIDAYDLTPDQLGALRVLGEIKSAGWWFSVKGLSPVKVYNKFAERGLEQVFLEHNLSYSHLLPLPKSKTPFVKAMCDPSMIGSPYQKQQASNIKSRYAILLSEYEKEEGDNNGSFRILRSVLDIKTSTWWICNNQYFSDKKGLENLIDHILHHGSIEFFDQHGIVCEYDSMLKYDQITYPLEKFPLGTILF